MSITYSQFVVAVESLTKAWRSLTVETEWERVEVAVDQNENVSASVSFLRIKRRSPLPNDVRAASSHFTKPDRTRDHHGLIDDSCSSRDGTECRGADFEDADENKEVDEDALEEASDSEALPRKPSQHLSGLSSLLITYDIIYSPTYQVPVLYINVPSTAQHNPTLQLETIYTFLVPQMRTVELQQPGVMGALSRTEHPVTELPVWFVHPCRTGEGMLDVTGRQAEASGQKGGVSYLLTWFGLVGTSVGLNVPMTLAEVILGMTGK